MLTQGRCQVTPEEWDDVDSALGSDELSFLPPVLSMRSKCWKSAVDLVLFHPSHTLFSHLYSDRSSLQSLTSSITNYVYKNGRRYAASKSGAYRLPNDEVSRISSLTALPGIALKLTCS